MPPARRTDDPEVALKQARGMLAKAASAAATEPEALAAFKKLRPLVVQHGFVLHDLVPASATPKAAFNLLEVVERVKAAAADPEIQKTVAAGTSFLGSLSDLLKQADSMRSRGARR